MRSCEWQSMRCHCKSPCQATAFCALLRAARRGPGHRLRPPPPRVLRRARARIALRRRLRTQLRLGVGEGAKCSVLALVKIVRVEGAKLCLVLVRFIKLLDSIVGFLAIITIWANLISLFGILTKLDRPKISRSFLIFVIVLVGTMLVVVLILETTCI